MPADERNGDNPSLSLQWLESPEEQDRTSLLEFARGTLYSLSRREDERFEPVHTSRIQQSFKKIGARGLHKGGLKLLELLREAESLFGGYWLPTPFRVVEIGETPVFIGAVPTVHGFLGKVRVEGLSRIITRDVAEHFPRQSLDMWMGDAPLDWHSVIRTFLTNHAQTSVQTSNLKDVEYLSLVPRGAKSTRTFSWSKEANEIIPGTHVAVCRQPHYGHMRYFSADVRKSAIASEAPILISIPRLLAAIGSHLSRPFRVYIRNGEHIEITVNERLPIEEFRLALLLSRTIDRRGFSRTFVIAPTMASALTTRLAGIGFSLEEYK